MPTYTLSALRQMALARLDNNSTLYTTPEVNYVINEALRTCALFTGFFRKTVEVPGYTKANQLVYTTPGALIVPSVLSFEGRQLQKMSLKRLARTYRSWAIDTTARCGRVAHWAPIGVGMFVIHPIDSVGGNDLTFVGIGEPAVLVNDGDVMYLENEYVEIVIEYCAHRLPLKLGGKIFADGSLALNVFYKAMQERKRFEAFKQPSYHLLEPKRYINIGTPSAA